VIDQTEVQSAIASGVTVTKAEVASARAYILKHFDPQPRTMLTQLLADFEAAPPRRLILDDSVPVEPQIKQSIAWITWQLSFGEALWTLVNSGALMISSRDLDELQANLEWTTGHYSSGWSFPQHAIAVPTAVRFAPSFDNTASALASGDLYIQDLGIAGLHAEVETALRQAVACFRNDLYLPCLAMLAKASEGAWTELGLSLLKCNREHPNLKTERRLTVHDALLSPDSSVVKKIRLVLELYEKQDVFVEIKERSQAGIQILREVSIWSNVVRDSRNAVHYGAMPASANNYEKTAALLMAAVPSLRTIYSIRRAAEELASTTSQ